MVLPYFLNKDGWNMATGQDFLDVAAKHLEEDYDRHGPVAPKNDPDYRGPWDCAEFVSWCVYQVTGQLLGCENNHGNPASANAFTGYWQRDMEHGIVIPRRWQEAAVIAGAILLRYPPKVANNERSGHIVFADGRGGTIEAKDTHSGVVRSHVNSGRPWDKGILVTGIQYATPSGPPIEIPPGPKIFRLTSPYMQDDAIRQLQINLKKKGFDPKSLDGVYGPDTCTAVLEFQRATGLVPDGIVGPQTAAALEIHI